MPEQFSVSAILKEGWQKVSGLKLPVASLALLFSVLTSALTFLMQSQHGFVIVVDLVLLQLLVWFSLCIFMALGANQAMGKTVSVSVATDACMTAILPLLGLGLIYFIVIILNIALVVLDVLLSTILYFIPFGSFVAFILGFLDYIFLVYLLSIIVTFAIPLILLNQNSIGAALRAGWRATNQNFIKLLLTNFAMVALGALGVITLGIGLIWVIPMGWVVHGIWFRNLCPTANAEPAQEIKNENENSSSNPSL